MSTSENAKQKPWQGNQGFKAYVSPEGYCFDNPGIPPQGLTISEIINWRDNHLKAGAYRVLLSLGMGEEQAKTLTERFITEGKKEWTQLGGSENIYSEDYLSHTRIPRFTKRQPS